MVLPHRLLLLAQTLTQVLLFLDLPLVQLPVEQNQTVINKVTTSTTEREGTNVWRASGTEQKHTEGLTVMTSTTQREGTSITQREGTSITQREGTSITQSEGKNVRRASSTAPCGTESYRAY